MIVCRDLRLSYDGARLAVDGVGFAVEPGEVVALIGPNGAGKSTTLRLLATLQKPDAGEVLWDGADAWAQRFEVRKRIGFLGDGTALYPQMTAANYLRFFAECYGVEGDAIGQRVDELLLAFDLRGKADQVISALSKGMRQRLAIARTLVHDPALLLLDEPADGLDPMARKQLRDILREVARGGVGIVISSHILRELDGFCDKLVVLERGRLKLAGPVDEVMDQYEKGRRVYELEVVRGWELVSQILAQQHAMVESSADGPEPGAGRMRVRLSGDDARAAAVLRTLVEAGVDLASFAKVRSDLEEVYETLGRNRVG